MTKQGAWLGVAVIALVVGLVGLTVTGRPGLQSVRPYDTKISQVRVETILVTPEKKITRSGALGIKRKETVPASATFSLRVQEEPSFLMIWKVEAQSAPPLTEGQVVWACHFNDQRISRAVIRLAYTHEAIGQCGATARSTSKPATL